MTPLELDAFAEVMARRRITRIKADGLEIDLSPIAFLPSGQDVITRGIGADAGYPTDEEMLFASSPLGPPSIKAEPPGEPQ